MTYYIFILIIWYFVCFLYAVYLYFNNSKPYYCEEIYNIKSVPYKVNPAELSILMYNKITPEVITATIVFLIKKGSISYKKLNNDYLIYKKNNEIKLNKGQKYLLELLFDEIGSQDKVKTSAIYSYCTNNRNSSNFLNSYSIWRRLVLNEISKNNYFEKKDSYIMARNIKIIGSILFIINIVLRYNLFLGYFIIIPSFLIMFYFRIIYKRTKEANKKYYKWISYGNYLNDKSKLLEDENFIYNSYGLILNNGCNLCKTDNYEFVISLNEAIKKSLKRANLYGNRSIFIK